MDKKEIKTMINDLYILKDQVAWKQEQIKRLTEQLTPYIKENKKVKWYNMNLIYVEGTERKTFDKKMFQEKNKDIDLNEYNKITKTKDSIRVSFDKEKEEKENE